MSRIQCPVSRACEQHELVSCVSRAVGRRHSPRAKQAKLSPAKTAHQQREKPTDKESGFESCPNSPRAQTSLETGHQCQCGAQTELRHQAGDCISLEHFRFIKKLGSGGYGIVVLVEKRRGVDRGALYALKMTSLNRAALVERDILPRLLHVPYTTDLAYAFFSAQPPKAFLALPYAIGSDLFSLAGPAVRGKRPGYLRRMFVMAYPHYVDRVRIVLAELSAAIRCLHQRRILYRDLKLENILVSGDGHIRLADFGLSRHFEAGESTMITGKTGTPDYMAPEVIRSNGAHGPATQYSFEADLWGLGVIAYELIVGQLPFKGRELSDLEESILNDPVEVPYGYIQEKLGVLLSNERPMVLAALSFIKALMQRNPRDRLTADQLPNHVFFRDLDWTAIESGSHDDPPFDIRRVVRELPREEKSTQLPSAFSGIPSEKRHRRDKGSNSAFENPAKYRNYQFCSTEFGWYEGDLDLAARVDSYSVVPRDAVVDDDDSQWDADSGTALEDVPGLLALELAAQQRRGCPPQRGWTELVQEARSVTPDSACGGDSPASPPRAGSPDWPAFRGRLPSHPESPSASEAGDSEDDRTTVGRITPQRREDSDDDVVIVEVLPPRGKRRRSSSRRAGPGASRCLRFDSTEAAAGSARELASALSAALPQHWPAAYGWPTAPLAAAAETSPLAAGAELPPKKRRRFLQPPAAEPRVVVQHQPQSPLPPFSSLQQRAAGRC